MLETPSTNPTLRAIYAKAHHARAQVFFETFAALAGLFARRKPALDEKLPAVHCNS